MTEPDPSSARSTMRWSDPLQVVSIWVPAAILVAILVLVMTLVYLGSVVNPTGYLHGLPVAVVNQDAGASVGSQRVDFGQQLAAGLIRAPAVSSRLALRASTLRAAEDRMDVGSTYAAVVIPPGFSASLLGVAGVPAPSGGNRSRRPSC